MDCEHKLTFVQFNVKYQCTFNFSCNFLAAGFILIKKNKTTTKKQTESHTFIHQTNENF